MVVEFLGLAAVGKSTLARNVERTLRQRGVACVVGDGQEDHRNRRLREARIISSLVHFGMEHPRYVYRSLRLVASSRQTRKGDTLWNMRNWFARSRESWLAQSRSGVTVLEEGLFQAIWSVGFMARHWNADAVLKTLGPWIPLPHILVVVHANYDTIIERQRARDNRGRVEDVFAATTDGYRRARCLLEEVVQIARHAQCRLRPFAIMDVDNDTETAFAINVETIVQRTMGALAGAPNDSS